MKKIFLTLLALLSVISTYSCTQEKKPINSKETIETNNIVETSDIIEKKELADTILPDVTMVINDNKEDTENDIKIFPVSKDRDYAYIHYFVDSEKKQENIRIKIESQWGMDEKVKEDFCVVSDEIISVESGEWQTIELHVSASNLYFHRVTLYYNNTSELLMSKTIYTPYEKAIYSDFENTPPEFHEIEDLNSKEQNFINSCQYAVIDYATINKWNQIGDIKGWQSKENLYLWVYYKNSGSYEYEYVWFKIDLSNTNNYITGSNYIGIIPEGDGSEDQVVLNDYFYILKYLNKDLLLIL